MPTNYDNTEQTFLTPDYRLQEKLREHRRKQANDLLAKAHADTPDGEMVSGIYVPKNDNWSKFAQAAVGGYQNAGIDAEAQTEAQQLADIRNQLLQRMAPNQRDAAQMALVPGLEHLGNAAFAASLKTDDGFTLGEGQQRFDAKGKPIASGPAKPVTAPTIKQVALDNDKVQDQEFVNGAWVNRGQPYSRFAKQVPSVVQTPQRDRFQIVTDEDGVQYRLNVDTLEKSPIGVSKGGKPLNEAQGNALLFGTRAQAAHKVIDEIGTNYNEMKTAIAKSAENVPGVNAVANSMLSGNEQKVVQAQRDFINAVLRKESGAVINPDEFTNAQKQYFPQVGDKPEVLAQKKANRELAIAGLKAIAGRGASGSFDAPQAPAKPQQSVPAGTKGMHKGRAVVMGANGEWEYAK